MDVLGEGNKKDGLEIEVGGIQEKDSQKDVQGIDHILNAAIEIIVWHI